MRAHSGTFILAVIVCSCTLMLALSFSLIVIACGYALVAITCRYALVVYIIIHSHAITVAFSVYCYLMIYSRGLVIIICGCVIGSDFSCSLSCDV